MREQAYRSHAEAAVDSGESLEVYGGIGRTAFLGLTLATTLAITLVMVTLRDSVPLVIPLGVLALSVTVLALSAMRLRNIGAPRWWAVGLIVPWVNLVVGLFCLAAPKGFRDHRRPDRAAWIIVGLFVGTHLLAIVATSLSSLAG